MTAVIDFSVIVTVFFVITVGFLFIDLVPLQENMVCSDNYNNGSTCPEVFFAQSYDVAREKFIAAAKLAKAKLEQHVVLEENGFKYTIDTAFLPARNSKRLLVHMSGAGGVDGYTGSALQVKLLREWNSSRESEGPSVLFVHAVNPHGMSQFRRNNENNVDLDHNYRTAEDWKSVLARDPNLSAYGDTVAPLLLSRGPRVIDRYVFFYRLARVIVMKGLRALKAALAGGQHHHPGGLVFGGREEQRPVTLLREIIAAHATANVEKIVLMDVRSGHGWEGAETIVTSLKKDVALAKSIFKEKLVQHADGEALSSDFMNITDIPGKEVLVVGERFGTVHYFLVFRAILLENAAYNYARGSYAHSVMREWVRDAFYPQSIKYKKTVLSKGVDAFNCACRYLS